MQTQQKHHFLLHCYTSAQRWTGPPCCSLQTHDPAVELQEKDRDEKKKKNRHWLTAGEEVKINGVKRMRQKRRDRCRAEEEELVKQRSFDWLLDSSALHSSSFLQRTADFAYLLQFLWPFQLDLSNKHLTPRTFQLLIIPTILSGTAGTGPELN